MPRNIKSVLLIVNMLKDDAENLVHEISEYLDQKNIHFDVFGFRGKTIEPNIENKYDLAISLGGDGTVLFSSRILASENIPILAVNLGNFGFITEVSQNEWLEVFEDYLEGVLGEDKRLILEACITRKNNDIGVYRGMNDAVISSAGVSRIVKLSVELGTTPVGRYRADGIIVSTPTGSTAYSAAAGGPILHPEMEAMIINPICPFTLSHRPFVIPADEVIYIEVEEEQRTEVILTVDGQEMIQLQPKDKICVRRAVDKVKLVRSNKRSFYEVLRTKLNWSGGPNA